MYSLKTFEHETFGKVREVTINDEPWFVAKDVCECLELSNPTVVVSRLDDDEKAKLNLGLAGGDTNVVNEYGLYNLVLSSRKAEAKAFKRWITHSVIPSIRKTGSYSMPTDYLSALKALVASEEEKQMMKPKADYYDACMNSEALMTTTQVAKELGFKKAEVLNNKLEDLGVLYRVGYGKDRNPVVHKPKSKYPLVFTVQYDFLLTDGCAKMITTPYGTYLKWTNKGVKWLKDFLKI